MVAAGAFGVAVAALWVRFLLGSAANGWVTDHNGAAFAADIAAFSRGASLALDGLGPDLYDAPGFQIVGASGFLNPPFFAYYFVPFVGLQQPVLWLVWSALSLGMLWLALRLLAVEFRWVWMAALLLTLPGYMNFKFGQNSLLTVLLFAATYRLLQTRRLVLAGFVAGFALYKVQLLVGFGLWWLAEFRRYWKVLVALATAGVVLIAASWLLLPGAWPALASRLTELQGEYAAYAEAHFSALHAAFVLAPDLGTTGATAVGVVFALAVAAGYIWYLRRVRGHLEASFAAAVVVGLLTAPHLLGYDWLLLVVPYALVWRAFPRRRLLWVQTAVLLSAAAYVSGPFAALMASMVDWAVQPAVPVLLGVAVVSARAILDELDEEVRLLPNRP